MAYTLRLARPEDAELICNIHRTSIFCLCADHYTFDQLRAWAESFEPDVIRRAISKGVVTTFIAEEDGRIAGFAILHGDLLRALHVEPRFARRGVGIMLLKAAEKRAAESEISELHLRASLNSISFYKANGYRVVREAEYPFGDGLAMSCFEMEKKL